ncbi:hypothetical protein L7F22_020455 [Adiantum nelumboides]|nr:hypothetical protein [Adiantum nelumboides]
MKKISSPRGTVMKKLQLPQIEDKLALSHRSTMPLSRWVATSVCRALSLLLISIGLHLLMVMMGRSELQVLWKVLSVVTCSLLWLVRALGALLLCRLWHALQSAALVVGLGVGAILVHRLFTRWNGVQHPSVKVRKKKRKKRLGNPRASTAALNEDSRDDMSLLPAPLFSTWLFDYSAHWLEDGCGSSSTPKLLSSPTKSQSFYLQATAPDGHTKHVSNSFEVNTNTAATSDERAAFEVQEVLSKKPHTRNTISTVKHSRSKSDGLIHDCTIDHEQSSSSPQPNQQSNMGRQVGKINPRSHSHTDLCSPPLPPLEVIADNLAIQADDEKAPIKALQCRESFVRRAFQQTLAPWRQLAPAAQDIAAVPPLDFVSSLTSAASIHGHSCNDIPSLTPKNDPKCSPALTSSATIPSTPNFDLSEDDLHAQSEAFISRRQQQWRLQRLKSLQRPSTSP